MNSVVKSIRARAKGVHKSILNRQKPDLKFPIRSLANVRYDPKSGYFQMGRKKKIRTLTYNTVKTFAQTLRMISSAKELIETDEFATKREMYYNSKNWEEARFDEQVESDTVMDDVEALFEVNREQLKFVPEERGGSVAGKLIVIDRDPGTGKKMKIDCTRMGSGAWSVPIDVENLGFETKAKFILAIETGGMFQRLVKHNFWKTHNCILVELMGVPTRATRRFIRRLSDENRIPVYAFVDGDPYGFMNIYRTLKVGSGNAAHINEYFCVPKARFLGVTPQDIVDYDLPTHPLKDVDIKRAKDALRNDPFVKHHKKWQQAIDLMLKQGVRAEQQAFAKHGLNFVLEKYLPAKLKKPKEFLP